MFRALLTPLSGKFPLSPFSARPDPSSTVATSNSPDELAPEDFARDVMIEVMRTSLERLKETYGLEQQLEASVYVLRQVYAILILRVRS